jgi:FkbM family methyltransferase
MAAAAGAPRGSVRDRLALHPAVLRLKRAAAFVACHPAVGAGLGWLLRDRIPCDGLVVETPAAWVGRQAVAQLFFGIYEGAERRLLRRHLRRDLDVLELGSSIGVVSASIARLLDPGARLVCVEANADLVPLIRANLARNAPGRPVEIECAAVAHGSADGWVELHLGKSHTGSSVIPGAGREAAERRVPATTLGALLSRHGLGDYALVCDIEGAEAGVLFREGDALRRCRQLVIELHETSFEGRRIGVEEMCRQLVERLAFRMTARYGNVAVFEGAAA